VRAVGISTHERSLAVEAATRGLDVVMVRHSAAHRGAESSVFPACVARGTAVLTFSNLCYGRMLHRSPAPLSRPVAAPDCYRYSLGQPGVGACIAAPRRHSELLENLEVARNADLSRERMAELRLHGDHVYARSKAWSAETWSAPPAPPSGVSSTSDELADWVERPASLGSDSW
jgi:aryl-alcohol dehydrogenase-like predicted oxidoreductase